LLTYPEADLTYYL